MAAELGSQVESVSVLTGGVASQMLAVRTVADTEAVLRRMTVEPWRTFAAELLGREFEVQTMLRTEPLPTPTPIAVDLDGAGSGEPSLLMSRLPGKVDFVRNDEQYLAGLAELLVRLHGVRPPDGCWPREYQSWAFESKMTVPAWSSDDLAGTHGLATALGFPAAYIAAGGELDPDPDARRYWQLMDLSRSSRIAAGQWSGSRAPRLAR